jgi:hypothetical protein
MTWQSHTVYWHRELGMVDIKKLVHNGVGGMCPSCAGCLYCWYSVHIHAKQEQDAGCGLRDTGNKIQHVRMQTGRATGTFEQAVRQMCCFTVRWGLGTRVACHGWSLVPAGGGHLRSTSDSPHHPHLLRSGGTAVMTCCRAGCGHGRTPTAAGGVLPCSGALLQPMGRGSCWGRCAAIGALSSSWEQCSGAVCH